MARTLQKEISKFYHTNVDVDIEVIETTRINVLDRINELMEGIELGYDMSDMSAVIKYKDGSYSYIDESEELTKIRKTNIESAMYGDGYATYVYGEYEVNEYGSITI